jgi:hypothetical protein
MATTYAPEYSAENQQKLVEGYNALQNPAAEKAKRQLAQSLAGTAGMYGGARNAGLGQIYAQQQANTGQYAQNLAQNALEAQRGERLTAEERAYQDPYRQAELTGKYNGQTTLAGQQVANQASQFTQSLQQSKDLQTRALDLQQQGMTADEAYRKAQLEQQGNQFTQNLGLQRFQAEMPYLTQGYLDKSGNVTTEQQLQASTPENKLAQSLLGPNANALQLSQLATSDPAAYQELLRTGKLPSSYAGGMYGSQAAAPQKSGK